MKDYVSRMSKRKNVSQIKSGDYCQQDVVVMISKAEKTVYLRQQRHEPLHQHATKGERGNLAEVVV